MIQRIALLSIHSSPLARAGSGDAGGMNVYVRELAEGLVHRGVEVDIFTRRTDPRASQVIPLTPGARVVHLDAGQARSLPKHLLPLHVPRLVAGMRDFIEREGTGYDLLHSHYWLSGLVASRVRADDRIPFVHMFHTLSRVKELYLGGPDSADSALRGDAERCVIAAADAVVGATVEERAFMQQLYGRSPAEYEVIPPGVDVLRFQPLGRDHARRSLGIEAERVILFVGRLDRIKRLDILLSSMAAIAPTSRQQLRLLILGHEGGRKEAALRRSIARLGLADVVDMRGAVDTRELPLYYSAADVLAMPSMYESFGMAALEAMACETPVVAFAVGGPAATIRDRCTGFLARPGDAADFTDKLREALNSDLVRVGRRARLSVQNYTWDAAVEKTLELYDALQARHLYATGTSAAR